jgi:hypothetical protein
VHSSASIDCASFSTDCLATAATLSIGQLYSDLVALAKCLRDCTSAEAVFEQYCPRLGGVTLRQAFIEAVKRQPPSVACSVYSRALKDFDDVKTADKRLSMDTIASSKVARDVAWHSKPDGLSFNIPPYTDIWKDENVSLEVKKQLKNQILLGMYTALSQCHYLCEIISDDFIGEGLPICDCVFRDQTTKDEVNRIHAVAQDLLQQKQTEAKNWSDRHPFSHPRVPKEAVSGQAYPGDVQENRDVESVQQENHHEQLNQQTDAVAAKTKEQQPSEVKVSTQ